MPSPLKSPITGKPSGLDPRAAIETRFSSEPSAPNEQNHDVRPSFAGRDQSASPVPAASRADGVEEIGGCSDVERSGRGEGAAALVQEHASRVVVLVGDGQIDLAVAVEVADGQGRRGMTAVLDGLRREDPARQAPEDRQVARRMRLAVTRSV